MDSTDRTDGKPKAKLRPDVGSPIPKSVDLEKIRHREWWSLVEFAALTGMSTTHIREKYLKTGRIEAMQDGRRWMIHRSQLDVFNDLMRTGG